MALRKCPDCGKEMSTNATKCPHCGYKDKFTQVAILVLILLVIGIIIGVIWYFSYEKHLNDLSNTVKQTSLYSR